MVALLGVVQAARADAPMIGGTVRVDGLAAVVGGMAPGPGVISILRSDVELRARLSLLRAGGTAAALAPLPPSLLRASLHELMGEALIAAEAARLSLAAPSRDDVQRERQRIVLGAGGEAQVAALLRGLGLSERALASIAQRRAVVSGFLAANLEGTLEVTPLELERAYAQEDHPFQGQPLSEVQERLRIWLSQRRLEAAVGRWVESLKQRTPSRAVVAY